MVLPIDARVASIRGRRVAQRARAIYVFNSVEFPRYLRARHLFAFGGRFNSVSSLVLFGVCVTFASPLSQESLEERVQELEQALLAERLAAQRDRATITKLQRQINKVSCTRDRVVFPER